MAFDPEIQEAHDLRLREIGAICAQWSYLEYLLLRTMQKLLEIGDETAIILFGGLDIRPRMAMTIELAAHYKAPKRLRDAIVDTRAAVEGGLLKQRNRAIHGVQFLYSDATMQVEMHRGKDRKRREMSLAELRKLTDDIFELGSKLSVVINAVLWKTKPPPYTLLEKPAKRPRKRKPRTQDQKPKPRAHRQKPSPE